MTGAPGMATRSNNPIRPDGIQYWIHERPPAALLALLAIQQVAFLGSIMTLPVVLARAAGLDHSGEANLVALTMITAGVGAMLQAWNRFGIGIGLFSPMHTSGAAFPAALAAVKIGGLGLAFGMMSIAGLVQIAASRIVPRLRALFPVEIAGLTVLMLGLGLGMVGLKNFFALDTPMEGNSTALVSGVLTLTVIIGLNVWTKGGLQAFSVFVGLAVGQLHALGCGLVSKDRLADMSEASFFAMPQIGMFGWSFDWMLLPEFIIVGIALSLNCFGVLTVVQRGNDSGWTRPDMAGVGRGLLAEGLANITGSAIGGVTQTASGGAAGLAVASGVTSRVLAFAVGGLFIVLAFFPPVTVFWSTLAPPVIGAVLMFVAGFIVVGGLKITTSRLIDNRKSIMLGIALVAGIGHDTILTQIKGVPPLLEPFMATSLSVAILLAMLLNALFRIGIHRTETHKIRLDEDWVGQVSRLIWHLGHQWNASRDVVRRLDHATHELHDVLVGHELVTGSKELELRTRFDEFQCEIRVSYEGEPLHLTNERPSPDSMLEDPDGVAKMAGFLINRLADRAQAQHEGGRSSVTLSFHD